MAATTIGFGIALAVLGLAGFMTIGMKSPAALIPAAFGAAHGDPATGNQY